jgi:hypothetical protein
LNPNLDVCMTMSLTCPRHKYACVMSSFSRLDRRAVRPMTYIRQSAWHEAYFSCGLSVPSGDVLFGLLCFDGNILKDSDNEQWIFCNAVGEAGVPEFIFSTFRKLSSAHLLVNA